MDLAHLTDEDYFGHMKTLFQTDGWLILCTELKEQAEQIGDIQDIHDTEGLFIAKGQLAAIGKILNFEETIEKIEAQEKEADESPE
jgi:hypothetical protein|tara:strand:- start:250 stop:507 length:258 start_codon:yes stop_codon:yes gene_type:complete